MPQSVSLYSNFTVEEMIAYFCQIYGMSLDTIGNVSVELLDFLHLSHKTNVLIGSLSGGQKRRVSLALALTYSAKLIVLDEPTVGLDPLLRIK